jgi:hypothetical protein
MQFFQTLWRFLVAVQLLPTLEGGEGEETLVGGQAVLEGVMMRSPHAWAITCRKPSGELSTHSEPLERLSERHKWMACPVLRGVMTLGHAMALGFRALKFSANVQLDELQKDDAGKVPEKKFEISGWIATVNILFSVGFFIFMYKFLPLVATTELKRVNPVFANPIIENEVRRALETLALSHDSQKKAVSLHFAGEGKRKVEVGYVIENPIWKTSYRLVLDKDGNPWLAFGSFWTGIKMRRLDLAKTQVSDDGLAYLQGMSELTRLDLGGTPLVGDGLVYLQGLPRLERLVLSVTRVSDQKLRHLHGLPSLQANFGNSPIALRSRDGRLWLAMRTALAMVDPNNFHENSKPPPVLLSREPDKSRSKMRSVVVQIPPEQRGHEQHDHRRHDQHAGGQ